MEVTERTHGFVVLRNHTEDPLSTDNILLNVIEQLDGARATLFGLSMTEAFELPPLRSERLCDKPYRKRLPSLLTDADFVDVPVFEETSDVRLVATTVEPDVEAPAKDVPLTSSEPDDGVVLYLARKKAHPPSPVKTPPRPDTERREPLGTRRLTEDARRSA